MGSRTDIGGKDTPESVEGKVLGLGDISLVRINIDYSSDAEKREALEKRKDKLIAITDEEHFLTAGIMVGFDCPSSSWNNTYRLRDRLNSHNNYSSSNLVAIYDIEPKQRVIL